MIDPLGSYKMVVQWRTAQKLFFNISFFNALGYLSIKRMLRSRGLASVAALTIYL
jgi:hypothetical protein